jgi:hypothetical protein
MHVQQRLKIRRQHCQQLTAQRTVLQAAAILAIKLVLEMPVVVFLMERYPAGKTFVDNHAAQPALHQAFVVTTDINLHIVVVIQLIERRLLGDYADRATCGVLSPQCTLRAAQHFNPIQVEQWETGRTGVTDIHLVEVEANRAR